MSFDRKKSKNSQKNSKNSSQRQKIPTIKADQIWIYGKHPVKSVILNKKRQIFKILVTKNNQQELLDFIKENNLKIDKNLIFITDNDLISDNFTNKVVHQGFAILCSKLHFQTDNDLLAQIKNGDFKENILILDQLTDPHNIGAIIRSSAAFGVTKIVLLKQIFGGENATICKSSSGVIENIDLILAGNLNNFLSNLKQHDYWVVGLDGYGKNNFDEIKKFDKICLVIGNEGSGIRQLVKKNCDFLVRIPTSDKVESLNASNATAIALYEINK